jgi:hypothetical protein
MWTHRILLAAVGLTLVACDDGIGPSTGSPSTEGTLVISTSTGGDAPDQDGYLLTVDGFDSLALTPTGTTEIDLPDGQHTLQLLEVAEQCSVAPETPLEVDVPSQDTTSVAFEVSCPATGARITTTTTGLDIDQDGYRVEVDGTDRGILPSNGTVLTRLDPGSRTITLTDLAPNCTIDGPGSRTVTIEAPEIVSIEVAVVCTATTGVIGVLVEASGAHVNGVFGATVDGAERFIVGPGEPAYVAGVSGGDHVISLVGPANCSVETGPQSVTVIVGQLIRDTVEVDFSVTCARGTSGTVRITAPTTGPIPSSTAYQIWYESFGYWDYGGTSTFLGVLAPNDTLVAELPVSNEFSGADPYWYHFALNGIPANCRLQDDPYPYPLPGFTITFGDTLDIEYPIACSP